MGMMTNQSGIRHRRTHNHKKEVERRASTGTVPSNDDNDDDVGEQKKPNMKDHHVINRTNKSSSSSSSSSPLGTRLFGFLSRKKENNAKGTPPSLSSPSSPSSFLSSFLQQRIQARRNRRSSTTSQIVPEGEHSTGDSHSSSCLEIPSSSSSSGDDDEDEDEDDSWLRESTAMSNYDDIYKILQEFKKRERLMKNLLMNKAASYRAMMFEKEMAAQCKILQRYYRHQKQQQQQSTLSKTGAIASTRTTRTKTSSMTNNENNNYQHPHSIRSKNESSPASSLVQYLKHSMVFEFHHSLEGCGFVICYCIGNAALFSLVEMTIGHIGRMEGMTPYRLHTGVIISALMIMRSNGYLWSWLSSKSWEYVKFDLYNRHVLGYYDAHLLASFRKGTLKCIQPLVSLIAFYMLFISTIALFYDAYFRWASVFWSFRRFIQWSVLGCPMADIEEEEVESLDPSINLWNEPWEYFCRTPAESRGFDAVPQVPEPIFPQLVFYTISLCLAAMIMTKSKIHLFDL